MKLVDWMKPLPDAAHLIEGEENIAKAYRYWRIKMFIGMYVGYVMYYLTRKALAYVSPCFMSEYGIDKMQLGTLSSIMMITYGIGKFLSGVLADRCNIKVFMAFGLIGSAIINLFFGFLSSFHLLAFFWGLNGGFQSMGFPPVAKGLVYWFSPSERATKWTLWSSAHTIGTALIAAIAGICISSGNWRAAFYIPGVLSLITGIVLLFTLTDKPSSVGLPPVEEYRKDTAPVKKQSSLTRWQLLNKYVFGNVYLWLLSFAYIFVYFIRFVTIDWGTVFMSERGIAPETAAYLLAYMPLIGSLGGISAGWFADKFFKGRCAVINIIYLLLLIFGLWGMHHYTAADMPQWLIVLFLALVGFFVDGPQNLVGGVQASRLTAKESVSAATGFTGLFGYIGATFSGIGAAWIIEKWGWDGLFFFCGVSCVISVLFITATAWKEYR